MREEPCQLLIFDEFYDEEGEDGKILLFRKEDKKLAYIVEFTITPVGEEEERAC